MSSEFIVKLDRVVQEEWDLVHAGSFSQHVLENGVDADLYRLAMLQIYHYTRHNSINQAFASWRIEPERIGMLRFCYEHANEELGHEKMVVHDLQSVNLLAGGDLDGPPLPATEALIGYLYFVGLQYGAIPRLGYSYWAETAYDHIGALLSRARSDLGLTDKNMSFFVAHSVIDAKHAEEVHQAIVAHVRGDLEESRLLQVARTTLRLTGTMLNEVLATWLAQRSQVPAAV
jgi:hypothetical protein